ncbi:hypothetical protein [Paraburkholderia humisilvae]|uniref:hypothetical protein n=1 Tax=Paraburkholderia humisilvae TaxID=627669 RepID=UPI001582BB85|nr:hypothetical protein [Paraburkholderia humisilvae]
MLMVATIFGRNPQLPRTCVSTLGLFRELIKQHVSASIRGTMIGGALWRNHRYTHATGWLCRINTVK